MTDATLRLEVHFPEGAPSPDDLTSAFNMMRTCGKRLKYLLGDDALITQMSPDRAVVFKRDRGPVEVAEAACVSTSH